MHPFEFAIAIVALVLIFKLVKLVMVQRGTRNRDETVNADLLARLAQVEERVRVLERIVTDERFDLRQQFKDLES
jgi:hypothetical protein